MAARLAWLYMTGEWPAGEVDHKDLDATNDKWGNLRAATPFENQQNRRIRPDNSTGEKCIRKVANSTRWAVRTTKDGVRITRYFPSLETARHHRDLMLKEMHGEFARME